MKESMKESIEIRIRRIANGYTVEQINSVFYAEAFEESREKVTEKIKQIMKTEWGF